MTEITNERPKIKSCKILSNDASSEKLTKYKLEKTWDSFQPELKYFGFSDGLTDKIIVMKSSTKTVEAVVKLSRKLLNRGFTPGNITDIASHNGGSKNLEAATTSHQS